MNRFRFVICAVLLFPLSASSQANLSETTSKSAAAPYRRATLLKLTAQIRTEVREVRHTTMLDTAIVTQKIVTYDFTVRSGELRYISRYTPEQQPGNLPDAWWKGNAPVEIRVSKHKLLIRSPEGIEVASRIVSQTPPVK